MNTIEIGTVGMSTMAGIALYAEPTFVSPQVAELNFGECWRAIELDSTSRLVRIERIRDGYRGWTFVDPLIAGVLSQTELDAIWTSPTSFICSRTARVICNSTRAIHLPFGALLPGFDSKSSQFQAGNLNFKLDQGKVSAGKENFSEAALLAYLAELESAPYHWGGESSFGLDCSGLVKIIYRLFDIWLPRDSGPQSECGSAVEPASAKTGDLLFFGNKGASNINHVGFVIRDKEQHIDIFHACNGEVHRESLNEHYIFSDSSNVRELRAVKRLV